MIYAYAAIEIFPSVNGKREHGMSVMSESHDERTKLSVAITRKVRAQADAAGGYYRLSLDSSHPFIDIPRNPFILWALRGFDFERFGKVRPAWRLISPAGLKMPHDDPLHTDWMLGAGLRIDEVYGGSPRTLSSIVLRRADEERVRLMREWAGCNFAILSAGEQRRFSGRPVAVSPHESVPAGSIALARNAGIEYQAAMLSACRPDESGRQGLIICATGGRLAHLAKVGRELSRTILLVDDAISKLQHARELFVDLDHGQLYLCASSLEMLTAAIRERLGRGNQQLRVSPSGVAIAENARRRTSTDHCLGSCGSPFAVAS